MLSGSSHNAHAWVRKNRETNLAWLARLLPVSRVIAFGLDLARQLARLHASGLVHGNVQPQAVTVFEGPDLMRPRLIEFQPRRSSNPSCDIHGLGHVLYDMLAGEQPALPPHTPPRLADVIERCRVDSRTGQYETMAEAIAELEVAEREYHHIKDELVVDDEWEHWFVEGERLYNNQEAGDDGAAPSRLRTLASGLAVGVLLLTAAATLIAASHG
jgi:hypothetical protein